MTSAEESLSDSPAFNRCEAVREAFRRLGPRSATCVRLLCVDYERRPSTENGG